MSNVDLHSHVIPPTIIDAIRRDPQRFGIKIEERDGKLYFERRGNKSELLPAFYDVDAKIESMNRMQLDISAISVAPPTFFYGLSAELGLAAARLSNDGIAQMVAKYPARLRGMATLPMQDPDAAITELERIVREHRFKAVELGTSIDGKPLADPKYRPVLKTIEQLGCFVFAHPYTCVAKGGMDGYQLNNLIGYPLDTTIMVAHLMFSGALDELKQLRILLAHGGGLRAVPNRALRARAQDASGREREQQDFPDRSIAAFLFRRSDARRAGDAAPDQQGRRRPRGDRHR